MPARWKLASSPLEPRFQPRRSSFENECYQHNSTEKAERRFAGVATNRDRWKREIGFQRASPSSFPRTDLSRSSTYRNTFFYAARPNFSLHLFYPRFIPPGFRFSLITPFIPSMLCRFHPSDRLKISWISRNFWLVSRCEKCLMTREKCFEEFNGEGHSRWIRKIDNRADR